MMMNDLKFSGKFLQQTNVTIGKNQGIKTVVMKIVANELRYVSNMN